MSSSYEIDFPRDRYRDKAVERTSKCAELRLMGVAEDPAYRGGTASDHAGLLADVILRRGTGE